VSRPALPATAGELERNSHGEKPMTAKTDTDARVERLTEACDEAQADHDDDAQHAAEIGERPDLWDPPEVTLTVPFARRAASALTALQARVTELEGGLNGTARAYETASAGRSDNLYLATQAETRLTEAVEVIRPFAETPIPENAKPHWAMNYMPVKATYADVSRARAFLATLPTPDGLTKEEDARS